MDALPGEPDPHDRVGSRRHRDVSTRRREGATGPTATSTGTSGSRRSWHRETHFTLYDARHTFSSRLLAAGIPLIEVSAWMGHSLRAGGEQVNTTTRKYAHATGEFHQSCSPGSSRSFIASGGETGGQQEAGGVMSRSQSTRLTVVGREALSGVRSRCLIRKGSETETGVGPER